LKALRVERLTLVALTPPHARVAMEDRTELKRTLGVRVPEAWPGADFARMLPRIAQGVERASPGTAAFKLWLGPWNVVVLRG
jgi:hypothetical protein